MAKERIYNLILATTLANLAEVYKQKSHGTRDAIDFNISARTVRDYPGDILDVYNRGIIAALPGIDEISSQLIEEFFKTGKIKLYDDIRGDYPDELIRFIRISGLGKRRIFRLYELLGLKSREDLIEKAHESGIYKFILEATANDKEPLNEIQIKRFIDSVDFYDSMAGLTPRGFLEFFSESVINEFEKTAGVKKAVFTGSMRRKKPFVKDMDILLLPEFNIIEYDSNKSESLLKELCNLSFITELKAINSEHENISGVFKTTFGPDMEIIITSLSRWPVDLFYTTGSKKHIKKVEEIARKRDLFNGNSLHLKPASKTLARGDKSGTFASAENYSDSLVYEMLNMEYIPPELRENHSEVELALKKSLPRLINMADMKGDLHIHSSWSDGLIDFGEMAAKARSYGYEYAAITDHSVSNLYGNGLGEDRILQKIEYIKDLKIKSGTLKILMGGEVDIRAVGKMDYSEEVLRQMDIVLASMHSNYTNSLEENTSRVISAIKNSNVSIIAHPTGVVFEARAPYSLDMNRIIEAAAANDKALETNSYFIRLDLNENYARKVKEHGGRISINTDSHRLNNMDMIKLGVDVARRAGLEKKDVINTMSFDELMNWKKKSARDEK